MEFKVENDGRNGEDIAIGLIESDWNLKQAEYHDMTPRQMLGINRIRLEFKVFPKLVEDCWVPWINRIRLEFKDKGPKIHRRSSSVLIESDWNLKFAIQLSLVMSNMVLIESDWNLKIFNIFIKSERGQRINRIRLEFKAFQMQIHKPYIHGINRIRLKFKV